MTFHALAVDDNPDILEQVKDRLECLGHTYHGVTCMTSAREHLGKHRYSYILLDLEIPVRYGRPSRIPNGQNLLREIRQMKGYEEIPIIVMTSYGHDSPDLAVDVLRQGGATDFVKKPFLDKGHTLEKAVTDALASSGRCRPGVAKRAGMPHKEPAHAFECGEMVFSPSRVELCEVKICGGSESGLIRRILDELRQINTHGRYVRRSGSELAKRIGCERGQNGVAEAVAAFRDHACQVMLDEANIQVDRRHDIILNDRRYGYRLSPKITVRDSDDPVKEPPRRAKAPVDDGAAELNKRQQWAIEQMKANGRLRKEHVVGKFGCATKTAERDLQKMRRIGLIQYVGPFKTGHWKLAD